MTNQDRVEVVAAFLKNGNGEFLICQRPEEKINGLLWEFVGGKLEPGETKEEALIRECEEELGISVKPGEVFMELDHDYPELKIHLTLLNATLSGGTPVLKEHKAVEWIKPSEIDHYDFCAADYDILEYIKKQAMS